MQLLSFTICTTGFAILLILSVGRCAAGLRVFGETDAFSIQLALKYSF